MISVITVSYNSQLTIKQTFNSILNQSINGVFEYIVVDGGSTDITVDIILDYEKRFCERGIIFKWVSESDNGVYDAMNKGIGMCTGEVIGILNSDDFYELDTLQTINEALESSPNVDIYYGFLRVLMDDDRELQVYRYNYENFLGNLGAGCASAAQHPTCFVRKSLYAEIGLFNLEYKSAADYDFLLRAKLNGAIFKGLPNILTNFRSGGLSTKISDFDREDQRFRTHFYNGLITKEIFLSHLRRQKYRRYKILKSKLIKLLIGE